MMTNTTASASFSEDNDCDDGFLQDHELSDKVHLKILEQPCMHFRFRYASEMEATHGFITGRHSKKHGVKTYPTVQLCNYSGHAIIKCSLTQWDNENPHVHTLANKFGNKMDADAGNSYTVTFKDLCIIQLRQSEVTQLLENNTKNVKTVKRQSKKTPIHIELNKVRLKFTAFDSQNTSIPLCRPVYSSVIYSQKHASTRNLKICRMSRVTGSAQGGDEIFLLVEKVLKDDIAVRMVKVNNKNEITWSQDCLFNEQEDVHFQYAIVVKTPPYKTINIPKDVNVFIELYRKKSLERSERLPFTYTPEFKSSSYTSITDNGPCIDHIGTATTKLNTNSTPLEPGIHESRSPINQLEFSEDYRKPLQLIEHTSECELNTDEFYKFTATLPSMKDYFQDFEDVAEIMDIDFGTQLIADSIRRKTVGTSTTSTKEVSSRTTTAVDNLSHKSSAEITSSDSSFDDSDERETEIPNNKSQSKYKPGGSGIDDKSKSSGTSKTTVKIENTSDIDIVEASLDSIDYSDDFDPSTSHEYNKVISNQKEESIASKKDGKLDDESEKLTVKNIDGDIREIDARLLDAIENDDEAILEDLLDEGLSPSVCDDNGNNAVHCAVKSKSCLPVLLKVCQGMIGEALNEKNHDGKTPLHLAALQNSPKKVTLLMSHSAKYDAVDNDGKTALHLAAQSGYLEVVESILESVPEMQVDKVDGKGYTALQLVCSGEDSPNNRAIIKLLLEKGAHVTATVVNDLSAIQLSKDKPKMMQILQTYLFS